MHEEHDWPFHAYLKQEDCGHHKSCYPIPGPEGLDAREHLLRAKRLADQAEALIATDPGRARLYMDLADTQTELGRVIAEALS
jgi:hypothetical protein